jgi:hypothetical protein
MVSKSGPERREIVTKKLEYKSTIKSKLFLFKETKKAAELKSQGFKDFEIKDKARNDNIFQVDMEVRRSEIASIVLQRLNVLDDFLLEKVVNGNTETSKQIIVYSVMKMDRLFFEFWRRRIPKCNDGRDIGEEYLPEAG